MILSVISWISNYTAFCTFQDVQFCIVWKSRVIYSIYAKLEQFIAFGVKDTDEGGGYDGHDGTDRNGLLSVLQVTRTVWTSHDTCDTHILYILYLETLVFVGQVLPGLKGYYEITKNTVILTCDRGEVDANQQGEEAGDIS